MTPEILVAADPRALFRLAAEEFVKQASAAVDAKGVFTAALSGGSTPKGLYSLLAGDESLRSAVPWSKVHLFWGDERHVPPDHADSNYRMAHEAMIAKVPIPASHVHRIKGELSDAGKAADEYETELREYFELQEGKPPRFDLMFLGLGPEAHTASLFPGTKALDERKRLVVSTWVGKLFTDRVTMTATVFNAAACVTFLTSGEDKTLPLKAVLEGPYEPAQLPAQLIRPNAGRLVFMVDSAAARLLRDRTDTR